MINVKSIFAAVLVAGGLVLAPQTSVAQDHGMESHYETKQMDWTFGGVFGTYDKNQLQRGFQVFQEVCSGCHAARLLAFRNLSEEGGPEFSEGQVKLLAAEYITIDPEHIDGERPAVPADHWPSPFETERDARDSNNGALPPDFSVLAKARGIHQEFPYWAFNYFTAYQEGGPDFIYNLLTSYEEEPPHGVELGDGQYYNAFKAGGLSMAPPLFDEAVSYEGEGIALTTEQYAEDVAAFMMWVAEPHLDERKAMGFRTMIILILFAGLMFLTKRKLWSKIPH